MGAGELRLPEGIEPYYHDEEAGIVLYCGDCREILPRMQAGSADLVLTDPPYGFHKAGWDDEFPHFWFEDAARIAPALGLMPGVWNILSCPQSIGRLNYRWMLSAYLINGMTRGLIGFGNWIPLLVYTSKEISAFRLDGDCRAFAVGTDDKPDHPSPKPLNVMKWFAVRLPGDTILDPFAGSGTTLVASKILGRPCIGIELEERYCEIAVNRLRQSVLSLHQPAPVAEQLALEER